MESSAVMAKVCKYVRGLLVSIIDCVRILLKVSNMNDVTCAECASSVMEKSSEHDMKVSSFMLI